MKWLLRIRIPLVLTAVVLAVSGVVRAGEGPADPGIDREKLDRLRLRRAGSGDLFEHQQARCAARLGVGGGRQSRSVTRSHR